MTDRNLSDQSANIMPDSEYRGVMASLPDAWQPYAALARFDRPIGWWLLYWPCAWSLALAGGVVSQFTMLLWFLVGAVAMRSAGCVYNDIVDRELDRQVERTRNRPLASGKVSLKAAWFWLVVLCLIGLFVLTQLTLFAVGVALTSLALVAAYPFMKRITWWPQAWLGLVFSWGALVGWAQVQATLSLTALLLYFGTVFWVIGYDTIYALQDREDDALVGIKSSALKMGSQVRAGVALCYGLAMISWCGAFWQVRPQALALLALLPMALHLAWQIASIRAGDDSNALSLFRSNRFAGLLMALACVVVGSAG